MSFLALFFLPNIDLKVLNYRSADAIIIRKDNARLKYTISYCFLCSRGLLYKWSIPCGGGSAILKEALQRVGGNFAI